MKLSLALVLFSAIPSNASLRGSVVENDTSVNVEGWGELKCMFEAFSNQEKCAEAVNNDGEPCSYCTMEGGGEGSGLCVDPAVAPQMEQLNPSISCDPDANAANSLTVPTQEDEKEDAVLEGWGQLKCTFGAFSDKEKCAESTNGDGAKCSYCFIKDVGEEDDFGGLCVDPGIAPQMEQMNPALECDTDSSASGLEVVEEAEEEVKGWGQLKCMFEAFSNEEKCAEALNGDGEPCSYCVMEGAGDGSGLCVDPAVAPQMEQMNPSISCNPDATSLEEEVEEELGLPDYHDYKCAIKGMTDPRQCHHTTVYGSDEKCQFCEIDGPFGHSGLCVSPEHAEKMMSFNPDVRCDTSSKLRDETSVTLETE